MLSKTELTEYVSEEVINSDLAGDLPWVMEGLMEVPVQQSLNAIPWKFRGCNNLNCQLIMH